MTAELQVVQSQGMEARPSSGLALSFAEMAMRVTQLDQFYREVMQDGTDYGKIPGTDKPTLYQPGAQLLDQIFGYVPTFEVTSSSVIDWNRPIPFFHYVILCRLVSRRSGETVAEGIGSCNSHEDKYRWRNSKPACPDCGKELFRSKQKPEWFCWRTKGGCGTTVALEAVPAGGRVENEDTASLENTVSKMAQKRAHVAATLNATGASRIFTQDIEDLPQFQQAMQATVVQSSSQPVEAEDAPFGSEDLGPVVSTSSARTTAPSRGVDAQAATPKTAPIRPRPEPTPKENARARAVVSQDNRPPTRAAMIATLAQNIRRLREAGDDIAMPRGDALQGMSDEQLNAMIDATKVGLAAVATPA